jgi:hypothetical protein
VPTYGVYHAAKIAAGFVGRQEGPSASQIFLQATTACAIQKTHRVRVFFVLYKKCVDLQPSVFSTKSSLYSFYDVLCDKNG